MSSRTPRINLYAPKTLAVMDQAFAGLHGLPSRRSVARDNFPEKFTSHTGGSLAVPSRRPEDFFRPPGALLGRVLINRDW